jgi:1-deoxy-D-xylulose-5-phosphate reductoisomerase
MQTLTFAPADAERYPAIPLAFTALQMGGDSGAVLNAADEVVTELCLDGKIPFPAITSTVARVLGSCAGGNVRTVADVLAADQRARQAARTEAPRHAGAATHS